MKAIMKIQNLGYACKRWGRFVGTLLLPAFALIQLCSCDSDKAKPERPNEKDMLQEIVPVLAAEGSDFEGIADYGVSLYLFNEMSSECYKYQSADAFSDIKSFVVERAAYSLVALMIAPESANVSFEASMHARKNERITIIDMDQEIPDIVLGTAPILKAVDEPVVISDVKRLVGGLSVKLNDVSGDVTGIELTVTGLYDEVDFTGQYGFSEGQAASKKIVLKKNGSGFSNQAVMLPSRTDQDGVKMNFRVYKGSQTEDYIVKFSEGIVANQIAELDGKADDILKNAELVIGLTYAPWDNSQMIEDHIKIEDDLNKKWSSVRLPISGKATPGYDNFWASSALNTDWAKLYDSYLYDGIKDKNHPDEYWGPDVNAEAEAGTIPSWYIDLGASKEGITINYWNKFGGAGGQKIRTMKIYGSNSKSDYDGGNSNWVLISSFTSDKTLPTVDAGAEVTTGRIEFNKGNTSYRYVKCAMTSRVSNTGAVIEDSDVNVSEVEITVWSCK